MKNDGTGLHMENSLQSKFLTDPLYLHCSCVMIVLGSSIIIMLIIKFIPMVFKNRTVCSNTVHTALYATCPGMKGHSQRLG